MRKWLLAVALYFVIPIVFPNSHDLGSSLGQNPALAKLPSEPAADVHRAPDNSGGQTPPSTAPEAQTSPQLTAAQIMEVLIELAKPGRRPTNAEMCETLAAAALSNELPVGFFVRLIQQESGFNPEAVSPVGAQGVAQFMPAVAEEWGLDDPFDPHQALHASARFLRALREQFGNWGLAAAAYNAGMGRIQKWLDRRGKLPEETRHYVKNITGLAAEDWKGSAPRKVDFTIPPRAPCQEIAYLVVATDEDVPLPRPRGAADAKSDDADAKAEKKKDRSAPAVTASRQKPGRGKGRQAKAAARLAEKSPPRTSARTGAAKEAKAKSPSAKTGSAEAAKAKSSSSKAAKKPRGKGRVQVAKAQSSRR